MHEMKEKLIEAGTAILSASRTELYVAMRFLDLALSSLRYEMDLSVKTIGTDAQSIRFNPAFLIESFRGSSVVVNRIYMHMILHCVFRHMFHCDDKEDKELWDISCDIAVANIVDHMQARCVRQVIPDERQAVYDEMQGHMKVLTAEGIYKVLSGRIVTFYEMEKLHQFFTVDDHSFWERMQQDNRDDQNNQDQDRDQDDPNQNQDDQQDDQRDQNKDQPQRQNQQQKKEQEEREKQWQEISEKMRTGMETMNKDAADLAGGLYDYIKVVTRKRYDYKKFLKKFTVLREEVRLDLDSYDYIYYTFGLNHYGNMPLIEPLEYQETKKVEELAIVIDTSESCSGEYVRRFLEETFAILGDSEQFFKRMNVHIIQCDAATSQDTLIRSKKDMETYMENFQIVGFGGTDFRPAFDYVDRLCKEKVFKKLKGLLYFTDGYGTYPAKRPPYDTAFVFLEEQYNDRDVPPWAIKLVLGPEELGITEKS